MLNWLFPITCHLCGETAERTLCDHCLAALPTVPRPVCLYCGAPVAGEQTDAYRCAACNAKPRSFDFARSALKASDETISLIHDLKYHRAIHLGAALAPALAELWHNTPELQAYAQNHAALVPIPIGARRLKHRGYNQAEELALPLAKMLKLRVLHPLQRHETTVESQTRLSGAARLKNARLAYRLKPEYAQGKKHLPSHLVLVDDVFTTGATVRACAATLKQLPQVKHVAALTLLRVVK